MKLLRSLNKRKKHLQDFFFKLILLSNKNFLKFNNKKIQLSWEKNKKKINTILSEIKISNGNFSKATFTLNNNIPQLAWCLKLEESGININYGSGVIKHPKGIVEGVWDGNFSDFDYVNSEHIFGSGLTIDNGKLIITPPSHMDECVFLIQKNNNELIISNTLAYCLSFFKDDMNDDVFETIRRNYTEQTQYGVLGYQPLIYEHKNFKLFGLFYHNFNISQSCIELNSRLYERNYPNFNVYTHFLKDKLISLINNGSDEKRTIHLSAFSTLSNGYDSPAVTCLLKKITNFDCATINVDVYGHSDSGIEIAKKLGIKCIPCQHPVGSIIQNLSNVEYSIKLADISKDFFATQGLGDDSVFLAFDDFLDNKILFTGGFGDSIWGVENIPSSGLCDGVPYGKSLTEYRVRKGFACIPVPVIGAIFPLSIYRLSLLDDMKTYSIKSNYNRPIARRLIESEGVPRGMFATRKNSTNPHVTNAKNFKSNAFYTIFNKYDFK